MRDIGRRQPWRGSCPRDGARSRRSSVSATPHPTRRRRASGVVRLRMRRRGSPPQRPGGPSEASLQLQVLGHGEEAAQVADSHVQTGRRSAPRGQRRHESSAAIPRAARREGGFSRKARNSRMTKRRTARRRRRPRTPPAGGCRCAATCRQLPHDLEPAFVPASQWVLAAPSGAGGGANRRCASPNQGPCGVDHRGRSQHEEQIEVRGGPARFSQASIEVGASRPLGGARPSPPPAPAPGRRLRHRADAADARHDHQRHRAALAPPASARSRGRAAVDAPSLRPATVESRRAPRGRPRRGWKGPTIESGVIRGRSCALAMGATTGWWRRGVRSSPAAAWRVASRDFDSDASATNQALGMSVGRPIGMPAILGVSVVGMVGVLEARRRAVDTGRSRRASIEASAVPQPRLLSAACACVPLQPSPPSCSRGRTAFGAGLNS